MNILVTGGAGYIGSHMVLALKSAGHHVVVVDNLTTGHRTSVPSNVPFYQINCGHRDVVEKVLKEENIECVFHFAASASVPESMLHPLKYFSNNFNVTKNLVEACLNESVSKFIFSSTAAVYGEATSSKIAETAVPRPINPYGESKLACENLLKWISETSSGQFQSVILRYFNVAGASPCGELGQNTKGAHHLIKIACEHAVGVRDQVTVFGNDYATRDGTCIRDYIHIMDLVSAHKFALKFLDEGDVSFDIFNCGYGTGYSVLEVLNSFKSFTGRDLDIEYGARRAGDPEEIVADGSKIRALGWVPEFDSISTICKSAYLWEKRKSAPGPKYDNSNRPKENHYIQ